MQIKKWWGEFRSQVAIGMIVAIALGLVGAVKAALWAYGLSAATAFGTPATLGAGLVCFVVVVGAINQLQDLDARAQRRRLAKRTPADIERQVWEWLRKQRFSAKELTDSAHDFAVEADDDRQVPVVIAKAVGKPWVSVGARVLLAGSAIIVQKGSAFQHELAVELIHHGVDYQMTFDAAGKMTEVHVARHFVFDEGTHALDLFNAIQTVRTGLLLVSAIMQVEMLTVAPPPSLQTQAAPAQASRVKKPRKR